MFDDSIKDGVSGHSSCCGFVLPGGSKVLSFNSSSVQSIKGAVRVGIFSGHKGNELLIKA